MLRLLVLLLLLANGLFYAWSQDWLRVLGLAPERQQEPQRLTQQIEPRQLRLLKPGEAPLPQVAPAASPASAPPPAAAASAAPVSAASAAASSAPAPAAPASTPASAPAKVTAAAAPPAQCLQAGVFDDRQAASLRSALAALPAASWKLEPGSVPPRWIIYMGRYPDNETLEKKRAQLRTLKVRFEAVASGSLAPGLSLGGYASEAEARSGLATLAGHGVRTARVVLERAELKGHSLKLPAANAALRARVEELGGALAGHALRPCR